MKRFAWVGSAALFAMMLVASPAAADDWQLRMVPLTGDDWAAVKFNDTSGETWRAAAGDWVRCEEPSDVPSGDYDISIIGSDAEGSWYAIRINTETGRTWKMVGGNWVDMIDNYPEGEEPAEERPGRQPK